MDVTQIFERARVNFLRAHISVAGV